MAFIVPDALWNTFATATFGALLASVIVAYLTQRLTEKRERRNRRDQLRLDLYVDVVDLVLDNELAIAERGTESTIPPVELQTKRIRISHRLKLLGSQGVREAYDGYRSLVFQETARSIEFRSKRDEVDAARDKLIELMSRDIGSA